MTRANCRVTFGSIPAGLAAALWLLLIAGGCQGYKTTLPTASLRIGSKQYTVEVAGEDASRQKGLMERDFMPADYGMLFVFPDEQPRSFYMKNTHIPLDIVFLDHTGHVVSVKTMRPLDLQITPSDGAAMFAIELNAGQAAACGIRAGDVVQIPQVLRQDVR